MILTYRKQKIEFEKGENLLAVLQRAGVPVFAPCAGRGTCGKCKVKLNYFTVPSKHEEEYLTGEELAAGIRLACCIRLEQACTVETAETVHTVATVPQNKADSLEKSAHLRAFCDLGTTTVTVAFADDDNKIVDSVSEVNAQIAYGADVLSRIGDRAHHADMTRLIRRQLEKMVGCKADSLVVSGNTSMLHLLAGADTSTLGVYPFTPVFTDSVTIQTGALTITTLPCLNAFLGADAVAGVLACKPEKAYKLLVDLGTNAEIVLFNQENLFAVSAPAGPAFEGADIRCGCAAVDGAVSSFRLENGTRILETIGQKPPIGICGSGLLDLIAALRTNGLLSADGTLSGGTFTVIGNIKLYAEDVHAFLLAKAAVRTGIDLLLKKAGCSGGEISAVYLSGGFGTYLDPVSAAVIGLLPPALAAKATAAGNTSLLGAMEYAGNSHRLPPNRTVFNPAADEGFNECFMKNLTLPALSQ